MSFLSQAKKPSEAPSAPLITVVGSPGSGKSSFAGTFPNPIFMQAEFAGTVFEAWDADVQPTMMPEIPRPAAKEGTVELQVSAFEIVKAQMRELASEDHGFKTLVIDSVTALNGKFEQEIMLKYGTTTVADAAGGFHKGFQELQKMHSEFIYWCEMLRKRKGMAVIFLAHAGIHKVKHSPDESSQYSVYTLDMHQDSAALYVNNSDAVYYIKKETFVQGAQTDKKGQVTKYGRAMQTGERILITSGDGRQGYVSAKCRYGAPSEIPLPLGINPVLQHIPFFNKEA